MKVLKVHLCTDWNELVLLVLWNHEEHFSGKNKFLDSVGLPYMKNTMPQKEIGIVLPDL